MEINTRELRFKGRVPVTSKFVLGQVLKVRVEASDSSESFTCEAHIVDETYKDNQDGKVNVVSVAGLIRTS